MDSALVAERLRLRVSEATSQDVGRGLVRLHPNDMHRIHARAGDVVMLVGERNAVGKVMPSLPEIRREQRVQIDGILRNSAGVALDEIIEIEKVEALDATKVTLRPCTISPFDRDLDYLASLIDGLPVNEGTRVCITLFGNETIDFDVVCTEPKGAVLINAKTRLQFDPAKVEGPQRNPSYEDIGGAKHQLSRIREMIELPLRFPEVFERLGISAPCGVLLYGPPGCGKTLIARTIAHETDAKFFTISGPEIIHKHYGESEAHLRKIFDEASRQGPSIIFLDEIDAIAPKRELAAGDVERRVVAQLLTLMDGLNRRGRVVVIAATNRPNALDPALRRPGRFDREIEISIPDRSDRQRILEIHTRGMPLAHDVALSQVAAQTHGFVGADLESLCREAAMTCLRRFLDTETLEEEQVPYSKLSTLRVTMSDFSQSLQSIQPSAIREVFVEVPSVSWAQVGGLENVKQKLKEAISWPLKYQGLFDRLCVKPPRGILLCGPPGCGKTLIAKAAATESQVNFISLKGPELLSKFVGDSERAVREIFEKARQSAPCLMFFDEIDGLCPTRQSGTSDSGVSGRVLTQFLTELDGIEDLPGVFVLAATNRVDLIDPALRRFGRFEETIMIPLPDEDARTQIFATHLQNRPTKGHLDLTKLASMSQGFSGADIAAVCSQVARQAIRRFITESESPSVENTNIVVDLLDLDAAIQHLRQSKGDPDVT